MSYDIQNTGGMVSMTTQGFEALIDKLNSRLGDGMVEDVAEALQENMQLIFDRSQVLVPVDTGRLKESGKLLVWTDGDRAQGTISYSAVREDEHKGSGRRHRKSGKGGGSSSVDYAIYVHERTDLRHKPPTQDHFLSTPFYEFRADSAARLRRAVMARFTGL